MTAVTTRQPVLVKRYAGSRLYDTERGCYVSVGQLRQWTAEGLSFRIVDAASGTDITGVVMA